MVFLYEVLVTLFNLGCDLLNIPLTSRLRPQNIDEIVGQEHIIGPDRVLSNIINSAYIPNMIFYGPPGTGKTTIANIISEKTNRKLHKLNATTATSSDLKQIFNEIGTLCAPGGVLLYLDEIQYFSKKQQQLLLEFLEDGRVTLIASTTENPYFYIYKALLSRSSVFEFLPIQKVDLKKALVRALEFLTRESSSKIYCNGDVLDLIATQSGGDVRKAINSLETCIISTTASNCEKHISLEIARQVTSSNGAHHDKTGDDHYDLLSAFQKSMRGSDPDASIYYLARLLDAGELIATCRRLMVCACEDVSLAYPQAMPIVKSCVDMALQLGMPEARIPLANAVLLVALSPKSNSAYMAINLALSDIKSHGTHEIPRHLKNVHMDGISSPNPGKNYLYTHDFKDHWVQQSYLPENLKDHHYYTPQRNKTETAFEQYWQNIKD